MFHHPSLSGNATFSTSTDRVLLEEDDKGVENARLIIESITLNDYNDYTCEARNNATDITGKPAHVTMTVRIRGMISEPPTNICHSA